MSYRIVVIDDEVDLADLIRFELEDASYEAVVFHEITPALAYIHANHVDLILTDIQMPRGTGLDLIKTLRGEGNEIPIVTISGFSDLTTEIKAQNVQGMFRKPLELAKLLTSVENILSRKAS